jgi:hypothetical protein
MWIHSHVDSQPWGFTAMGIHSHGDLQPWGFTAMGIYSHVGQVFD